MVGYIIRRIAVAIPVLIAISVISFVIIQLPPGDFGDRYKQGPHRARWLDRNGSPENGGRTPKTIRSG